MTNVFARVRHAVAIVTLFGLATQLIPVSIFNYQFSIPRASAAAGIYRPINYQAKVTSINGASVADGRYNMRFKIYDAATSGTLKWSETWDNSTSRVTMTGGLFSVALGTHVTMTGSVDFNSDNLYLQVEFDPGNDGTYEESFLPRRRFGSVPYAHNANTLDGLDSRQFVRSDTGATMSGTLTIKPNSISKIGLDILSTAKTAGTGGLRISTQGANHIVFGSGGSLYDVNLYRLRANVLKTDDSFYAVGTISGSVIKADTLLASSGTLAIEGAANIDGSTFVVDATNDRVGIGKASPATALEVLGTISGSNVYAARSMSGQHLYAASTFGGAGLADCDTSGTSKLLWDATTKRFSCGTDSNSTANTGALAANFDGRYVNVGGDTMTGALTINVTGGSATTVGLKVLQTISGATIHASTALRSSGTLAIEGNADVGGTLTFGGDTNIYRSAADILKTDDSMIVTGTLRVNGAYVMTSAVEAAAGGNLTIYTNGDGSVDNYATIQYYNGSSWKDALKIANVSSGNGTLQLMSGGGNVAIGATTADTALEVIGTISGSNVWAAGSASGKHLYAASTFGGAGLADCDTSGTSKLLWDATTKRFSCGTDSNSTANTGALAANFDGRYVNIGGDTMTGALVIRMTTPTSVGLNVVGTMSGRSLLISGTGASTAPLVFTNVSNGRVGIGTSTPGGKLEIVNNGTSPALRLRDPSYGGAIDFVNYYNTTVAITQLVAATIGNTGTSTTYYNDYQGHHLTYANKDLVFIGLNGNMGLGTQNASPGSRLSVSGSAIIGNNLGTVAADAGLALEVLGTASGTNLFASSSVTGSHLYAASTFGGAGLADCDTAGTSKLLWDATTKRFSCGTDQNTQWSNTGALAANFDGRYVNVGGDTMTGALTINLSSGYLGLKVIQTASGSIFHAEKALTSSGVIVVESTLKQGSGALTVIQKAEFSTGAYVYATGGTVLALDSYNASQAYPHLSFGYRGTFDTALWRSAANVLTTNASILPSADDTYDLGSNAQRWRDLWLGPGSLHIGGDTSDEFSISYDTNNGLVRFGMDGNTRMTLTDAGALSVSALTNCPMIVTNGSGLLSCGVNPIWSNTGALAADFDGRYVNIGGDTMTGRLVIDTTLKAGSGSLAVVSRAEGGTGAYVFASGASVLALDTYSPTADRSPHIVFGYRGQFDTNLYRSAQNTLKTDDSLHVLGTASGTNLFASRSMTGRHLYAVSTFGGAGLADCDTAATSKLLWDATTKQFSCGTDANGGGVNTGALAANFDGRYVNVGGDTMTGALTISVTSGTINTIGLKVINTFSGAIIRAQRTLASSGTLAVESGAVIGGRLGIGLAQPRTALDVLGTISGSNVYAARSMSGQHLYAASTFGGAGLADCDTAGTSKLLWDATTKRFSCGTDSAGGGVNTGALAANYDGRYVNVGGDTMTGALTINVTGGSATTVGLKVLQTLSGATIHASTALRSSGTLAVEGQSTFQSGVTIRMAANKDSLRLYDTTNSDSVSFKMGIGNPNGSVSAEMGSLFFATDTAKIWKNTNGSTAWSEMDSGSGSIHMGKMTLNSAQTIEGTAEKILFNGEEFDVGDIADSVTNDRFDIVKTGKYLVTSHWCAATGLDPDKYIATDIMKNGSTVQRAIAYDGVAGPCVTSTDVMLLTAGDYLEMYVFHNNSTSVTTNAGLQTTMAVVQMDGVAGANAGGGSSLFTDGGTFTYLTDTTDNLLLGATGTANAKLEVIGTISGSALKITNLASFSGAIVTESGANIDAGTFYVDAGGNRVGINTTSPTTALTVVGMGTGATGYNTIAEFRGGSNDRARLGIVNTATSGSRSAGLVFIGYNAAGAALEGKWELGTDFSQKNSNSFYFHNGPLNTTVMVLSGSNVGIGTYNPRTALEVIGTVSGSNVYAARSMSGQHLYAASTFGGAGLADCDTAGTSKLLWDATTKRFSCGTDANGGGVNTGALAANFDGRYVNVGGDTMTGALTINLTSGTVGLEVIQTISGSTIFANNRLVSSGTLVTESGATFDGGTLHVAAGPNRVGIGTMAPAYTLDVDGTADIRFRNTATNSREIVIDPDQADIRMNGNNDALYLNRNSNSNLLLGVGGGKVSIGRGLETPGSAFSVSGATVIGLGSMTSVAADAGLALEVIGTASGRNLFATKSITGSHLYAASTFGGAGLADCDTAGTSKLLWDATTKQFSCGTDGGGSVNTGALAANYDGRYVNVGGDTMTGALTISVTSGTINTIGLKVINTFSGAIVQAAQQLRSSGTLTVKSTARFQSGVVITRAEDTQFLQLRDSTNSRTASLLTGSGSPEGTAVAGVGSIYSDNYTGKVWKKASGVGATGWTELASGSGSVHMTKMRRAASQSLPANGVAQKIYFDTLDYNVGSIGNVTAGASGSGRVTISRPGKYLVTAYFHVEAGLDDGKNMGIIIRKNNAQIAVGGAYSPVNGAYENAQVTTILDLAANDYLEVFAAQNNTTSLALRTGAGLDAEFTVTQIDAVTSNGTGGGGSSLFTDGGPLTYLTDFTDNLLIGASASANAKLEVVGTISGSELRIAGTMFGSGTLLVESGATFDGGTLHIAAGPNRVGIGTTAPKTALEVIGTVSGSTIYAATALRSSGSLVVEGTMSGQNLFAARSVTGAHLYAATTFGGAGLADCDTAGTSKLLWDATTKRFSCGTDANGGGVNTGALAANYDGRYVNIGGDTMTGALTINVTGGSATTVGLKVLQTISGATIHASTALRSSGSLSVEGTTYVGGRIEYMDDAGTWLQLGPANFSFAAGNVAVLQSNSTQLTINAGGNDVDFRYNDAAQKPLIFGDAGRGKLGIGTETPGSRLAVSGAVIIGSNVGSIQAQTGVALEVIGTASGANLFATRSITGSHLYAASTFGGAGLADCDGSTSKLLWDATTKTFSCGTVSGGTSVNTGALAANYDGRYVNVGGDTMTGALTINLTSGTVGLEVIQTISGSTIFANNRLVSSGTLVTESGATFDGGTLHIAAGPNRVGIGTMTPRTALEVLGTVSGSNVYSAGSMSGKHLYAAATFGGAGLADCDTAGTSKLLWDATTKTFSCGTDANGGGVNTGALAANFDGRYVNVGGDTMTGALTINVTGGSATTVGLKVLQTISGATIHASTALRSSGTLIVEGTARVQSGVVIERAANADSIVLRDTTNSDSVSFKTGTGDPNGSVSAQLGSLFIASDTGKIWKNNNGSTQWSEIVTGSGTVHMAKMRRSAAQTIPDNSYTKIAFDAEDYDVGGIADATSNDRFTILKSGKYLVTASYYLAATSTSYIDAVIYKNGSSVAYTRAAATSVGDASPVVTTTLDLVAGDYIEFYAYQLSGAGRNTSLSDDLEPTMSVVQVDGVAGAGGGSSKWTDGGSLTYLTESSDNVVIGATASADAKLEVIGTISGSALKITNLASFSGAIVTESGATFDGGTLHVAAGPNRVGIGTMAPKTAFEVAGTMSGAALIVSGRVAFAGSGIILTQSGQTVFNEQSRNVDFRIEGDGNANLFFLDASADRIGIGTAAPKATLDVIGTVSGSNVYAAGSVSGAHLYAASTFGGAGLADCDTAASSKLLWDATTKRFSCGTDQSGGGSVNTGALAANFDGRYVNVGGDTMTGALTINLTSGYLGLKVIQTASGSIFHAEKALTSSGVIVVESTLKQGSGALTVAQRAEYATGAYIYASGASILALDSYVASGGARAPHISFGYRGAFDTNLWRSGYATLMLSGSFLPSVDDKFDLGSNTNRWRDLYLGPGSLHIGTSTNNEGVISFNTLTNDLEIDVTGDGDPEFTVLSSGVLSAVTVSGSTIHAANTLTSSGGLVWEGTASGSALWLSTLEGAGLTDCDQDNQTLGWDETTKRFVCGTDDTGAGLWSSTGALAANFDGRYVNIGGDTMTGALTINLTSGTVGLEVIQTISGSTIFANNRLVSSGTLVTESGATFDSGTLHVAAGPNRVGIGTMTPRTALEVLGTVSGSNVYSAGSMSGKHLYAASTFGGAGLADCDDGTNSKLLWDATTKRFSCGTDQGGGGGMTAVEGNGRYVNVGGDTMTGALTINLASGTVGLEVIQIISGSTVFANSSLRSSGSLVVEKGVTLNASGGANDLLVYGDTSDRLLFVDATNNGVQIGDGAGADYLLDVYSSTDTWLFKVGSSDANSAIQTRIGMGKIGAFSQGDSALLALNPDGGNVAINKTSSKSALDVLGTVSGSNVYAARSMTGRHLYAASTFGGAGLADCDTAATSKLLWDATTKQFSCGTDQTGGGTGTNWSNTGSLARDYDGRYVNVGGDTMTGALTINVTSGTINTIGLKVINTFSGAIIQATRQLRSSGSLVTESGAVIGGRLSVGLQTARTALEVLGTISGSNIYSAGSMSGKHLFAASTFGGAGLASCNNSTTSKLLYNATTKQFECGTDQGGAGSGISGSEADGKYVNIGGDTMTGALNIVVTAGTINTIGLEVFNTISGSIIHTNVLLRSSGTLVTESGATFDGGTLHVAAGPNRVGVGTTSPKTTFEVAGTMSGVALIVSGRAAFAGSGIILTQSGQTVFNEQSRNVDFRIEGDSNANLFYLDASLDRVGIGTATPKAAFDVLGTMSGAALTVNGTMSGRALLVTGTGSRTGGNSPILATLASRGAVGIGTNNPAERLTVGSGNVLVAPGGNLKVLGGLDPTATAYDIAVQGKYAYIGLSSATGNDFRISDLSQPTSPSTEGGFDFGGDVRAVAVAGRYAYVGLASNASHGELVVLDVSNPSAVVKAGSLELSRNVYDVQVVNGVAYVAMASDFSSGEFAIYDVSNPASIRQLWQSSVLSSDANVVHVNGRYAYVGIGSTLYVYDVSNPGKPVQRSTTAFNGTIKSVYVSGRMAHIGLVSNVSTEYLIYDVSDPTSISSVGSLEVGADVNSVTVGNRQAYLGVGTVTGYDVRVVDVLTPSSPRVVSGLDVSTSVQNVTLAGKLLLAGLTSASGNDFRVFDLPGLDAPAAAIGAISTNFLSVAENAIVANNLTVGNSLTVGLGGIQSQGPLTILTGSGGNGMTGALIRSRGKSGALLALDAYMQTEKTPHISFGYRGSFDVEMYRHEEGGLTIDNERSDTSYDALRVVTNYNSTNNTIFRVAGDGNSYTEGSFTGGGADYAEYFYSSTPDLKQGEVVCIDVTKESTVKRCERGADGNVIGIVSHPKQAAFIGNKFKGLDGLPVPGTVLVGLLGQVKTKVIVETSSGAIRAGDALTSASKPGYARKAGPGESTVGVALQAFASGEGTIDVLISRRNQSLTVEAVEDKVLKTIASLEIDDEVQLMVASAVDGLDLGEEVGAIVGAEIAAMDLDGRIARVVAEQLAAHGGAGTDLSGIESRLAALEARPTASGTVVPAALSGTVALQYATIDRTLAVGSDLRVGGDLYLEGALMAPNLFVPGSVTVDGTLAAARAELGSGSTVNGVMTINGELKIDGAIRFASGSWMQLPELFVDNALYVMGDITIEGLATFLGDVKVGGELVVSTKQAGYAVIPQTGTSVTVLFGSGGFKHKPVVTASPDVPVLYAVTKTTQTGFTIRIAGAATEKITFSWLALATEEPLIAEGEEAEKGISFPIDSLGYPLSDSEIWNACIRNRTMLDADGLPYSCARYHVDSVWTHPDLNISFTFNGNLTPPYLKLPEGYDAVVTQLVHELPADEPILLEASSSSSAAASEETSSSAEAVASEAAASVGESAPASAAASSAPAAPAEVQASSAAAVEAPASVPAEPVAETPAEPQPEAAPAPEPAPAGEPAASEQ